jgi:hypothetical protein
MKQATTLYRVLGEASDEDQDPARTVRTAKPELPDQFEPLALAAAMLSNGPARTGLTKKLETTDESGFFVLER